MVVFNSYGPEEKIAVEQFLPDRKMVKYMSREARAALAAAGEVVRATGAGGLTPVYYSTDLAEFENYQVMATARESAGAYGETPEEFVTRGLAAVTPLYQFRILQNTPLSLISICLNLTGEHAVTYVEAGSLLLHALCHPGGEPLLLGAGRTHLDGSTEVGFALAERGRLTASRWLGSREPAVEMFRAWAREGVS